MDVKLKIKNDKKIQNLNKIIFLLYNIMLYYNKYNIKGNLITIKKIFNNNYKKLSNIFNNIFKNCLNYYEKFMNKRIINKSYFNKKHKKMKIKNKIIYNDIFYFIITVVFFINILPTVILINSEIILTINRTGTQQILNDKNALDDHYNIEIIDKPDQIYINDIFYNDTNYYYVNLNLEDGKNNSME